MHIKSFGPAVVLGVFLAGAASAATLQDTGNDGDNWQRARAELDRRMAVDVRPQQARNVILFIADGMSIPTISAARIYGGEQAGDGETHTLSFEAFPSTALVRTYNTDAQVADSASTATALVTGHKTRSGAIAPPSAPSVVSSSGAHGSRRPLCGARPPIDSPLMRTSPLTQP